MTPDEQKIRALLAEGYSPYDVGATLSEEDFVAGRIEESEIELADHGYRIIARRIAAEEAP